ncbi:saccharopine dehydrogenase NADP-binding domain-containing protein [Amycolatopsis speibonae]|uniref:Saccharopine dehydrogenase NADP-binding domain-containing protein n=1 Tax=Amycolatopsis speibonae TaxID=1450224 RepID=A0ABV7PFL3_9PSEU
MSGVIGVLGGAGTVGRVVVDRLSAAGHAVRVGGRVLDRARAVPGASEALAVDLGEPDALRAFSSGCSVVVNCAGPSYRVLDVVARSALRAGAGYVDAAGDAVALDALTTGAPPELRSLPAVFSAGLMPGLSGLLPRVLAGTGSIGRLDVYVGGSVEISALSAVDTLMTRGPRFGHALAGWRDGAMVEHALNPLRSVSLPGFRGRVHAWPFLSTEAVSLAAALDVAELRNYTVYATQNLPEALAEAWAAGGPVEDHVDAVVEAARRDVAECGRHYAVLAHARPPAGSGGTSRRVLLRTADSYELSGVVAASAAVDLLAGRVRPGAHHAAEVLDPHRTAAVLAADPLVTTLELPEVTPR